MLLCVGGGGGGGGDDTYHQWGDKWIPSRRAANVYHDVNMRYVFPEICGLFIFNGAYMKLLIWFSIVE